MNQTTLNIHSLPPKQSSSFINSCDEQVDLTQIRTRLGQPLLLSNKQRQEYSGKKVMQTSILEISPLQKSYELKNSFKIKGRNRFSELLPARIRDELNDDKDKHVEDTVSASPSHNHRVFQPALFETLSVKEEVNKAKPVNQRIAESDSNQEVPTRSTICLTDHKTLPNLLAENLNFDKDVFALENNIENKPELFSRINSKKKASIISIKKLSSLQRTSKDFQPSSLKSILKKMNKDDGSESLGKFMKKRVSFSRYKVVATYARKPQD